MIKNVKKRAQNNERDTQSFFRNDIIQWMLISLVVFNILLWVVAAYYNRPQDFQIIVHYNSFFGVDTQYWWWSLFALPAMATIFLIVDIFLARWCFLFKERIAAHILLLAALLVHISMLVSLIALIMINR